MDVKFLRGLKENLEKVAVVNGQILFTTDTKEIFIDVGTERLEIADTDAIAGNLANLVTFVGTLPEDATADTIVGYINEKFAAATSGSTEAIEALAERVTTAEGDIDTLEGKVEALEIDAEKHADKTYVDEELAKKAAQADFEALKKVVDDFFAEDAAVNDVIDTLKEITTYIANDKEGAADLTARVGALETKVDVEKPVSEYVADAINQYDTDLKDTTLTNLQTELLEAMDEKDLAKAQQILGDVANSEALLKQELQAEIDADVKALADGAVKTNADDIAAIKEALTWGTF